MKIILEKEAETFLKKNGFKLIRGGFITNKIQISKLKLEFPWVMKVSSPKAIHKARVGGVIKNIRDYDQADQALDRLRRIKGFEGVIVQKKAEGQEFILGLKKTPEFGLVLMVGAGGSKVEELRDIAFRICPLTEKDAKDMLKEIRTYKKIKNKKGIIRNILNLSKLAQKYPNISELDINPLTVTKEGVFVVDARMVLEK